MDYRKLWRALVALRAANYPVQALAAGEPCGYLVAQPVRRLLAETYATDFASTPEDEGALSEPAKEKNNKLVDSISARIGGATNLRGGDSHGPSWKALHLMRVASCMCLFDPAQDATLEIMIQSPSVRDSMVMAVCRLQASGSASTRQEEMHKGVPNGICLGGEAQCYAAAVTRPVFEASPLVHISTAPQHVNVQIEGAIGYCKSSNIQETQILISKMQIGGGPLGMLKLLR